MAQAIIKRLKFDLNLLWIALLSIFAWGPLLTTAYFFEAHDAPHSVFFLVEFDQTFRDGYWWPRWSPDFSFGYGYPLFNLYAPLAFYAAELLHLSGLGMTAAIKTMYALATIGAGWSMYGFARRLLGDAAGLLAAIVYVYVPFHLVEIFVRSAYAEFVALAVVPLVFWAFTEAVTAPSLRGVALAGLSYGVLALTHHTTFFTFTPLLMAYILYLILREWVSLRDAVRRAGTAFGGGVLGVSLAMIYLLPVLTEARFVKIEQWTAGSYNYLQHFVYFSQLFSPDWGYGYAGVGLQDGFSYQLGLVVLVLVAFAVLRPRAPMLFFLGATLAAVWLMSPLGEAVWQILPIAALVQFPWRLLGLTAFTMAVVAGGVLAQNTPSDGPVYVVLLVVIVAAFPYTTPQYTEIPAWAETPLAVINWDRASIGDRVGMMSVTEAQPQTSPLERLYLAGEPLTAGDIIAGRGTIETLHRGGASSRVRVVAEDAVTVQFYTYEYPGWRVTRNGEPLPHRAEPPYGLVTVQVPPGEHEIYLRMGTTWPRAVGTVISALSLVSMILLGVFSRGKDKEVGSRK